MSTTTTMNTSTSIRQSDSFLPWLVVTTAALFFFYELVQIHLFAAINSDITKAFNMSATELGKLASISLWSNVIFLFPAGMILDRVSTKLVILVSMSIAVLGTYLFGMASDYTTACYARFFIGIGSAFCFLSTIRLATRWFPPQKMALVTGVVVTIALMGGTFAQTPMTLLTQYFGWRQAVMIDATFGIFIIGLIALFVKNYPEGYDKALEKRRQDELNQMGYFNSMRVAYLKIQNWLAASYTAFINLPIMLLGAVWGIKYLTQVHGLASTDASLVNSLLFIGAIFGGPFVGYISDKIRRRKAPLVVGALASILCIGVLISLGDHASMTTLAILFFSIGFFTSAQVITYPMVSERNIPMLTAMSVSIVSISVQGLPAVLQSYFGALIESNWGEFPVFIQNIIHYFVSSSWDGTVIDGDPIFTATDFTRAFAVFGIAFVLALIASLCVKETYCKAVGD